jgi:DEAD/DEAH box helicase domain-containing protein
VWSGKDYPAARISLRSSTPDSVTVVDAETGTLLGIVELERAYKTVHDGAVYLHLGEPYHVQRLDLEGRTALVTPFGGDWYTMAKEESETSILEERRRERRLGLDLCFGSVAVTEQVVAYQRRRLLTQEAIDVIPLDLPQTTFETEAVWYLPTDDQLEGFDAIDKLLGALHAAEHTMIALLPLWAMCDRWDIGGLSTNLHYETGRPTVFIYDGHAGGVGIAERGFDVFEGWVEDTARLLANCPCEHGCPSCVQSPKCGNLNEWLDKGGALTLLRRMLQS